MLPFQPHEGDICMCDFSGMKLPEMIKKRRVVIIHRHRENSKLVTVVPISTTIPKKVAAYHHKLDASFCFEHLETGMPIWVKCDMFYVLSTERLSLQKHTINGRYMPRISSELVIELKKKIPIALGASNLK